MDTSQEEEGLELLAFNSGEAFQLNFEYPEFCIDSGYSIQYVHRFDTLSYRWSYFSTHLDSLDNREGMQVLGMADRQHPYFIALPLGEGMVYLHTVPIALTNISLLQETQLVYASRLFSYLKADQLYWDTYSFFPEGGGSRGGGGGVTTKSPLNYLLGEQALRWAMYLCLAGAVLFVLFRAKRRQQLIPVISETKNTSLEFVKMLGQLHFDKQDHHYIARQQWRQFQDYIRTKYFLSINDQPEGWMSKLSAKSGIEERWILGIMRAYNQAQKPGASPDELMNFFNKLKYFYATSK
jgi:hypothetical protein